MNLAIEYVNPDELHPHPNNINEGDVGDLIMSIRAHGFFQPIGAQRDTNTIIFGKSRWRAGTIVRGFIRQGDTFWARWSRARGDMETLPVVYYDVNDEEAVRMMLVDDRARDRAQTDRAGLADLLLDLDQTTTRRLFGTGYDQGDLNRLVGGLATASFSRL